MKIKRVIISTGIVLFLLAVLYFGYLFYQATSFIGNMGPCSMYLGPCYGEKIKVKIDSLKIDQYVNFPNGRFAFAHTQDTLPPIFIKLDKTNKLVWAFKLVNETDSCWVPLRKMSGMYLQGRVINFFNNSYGEPALIYLDNNYNFRFICCSPM